MVFVLFEIFKTAEFFVAVQKFTFGNTEIPQVPTSGKSLNWTKPLKLCFVSFNMYDYFLPCGLKNSEFSLDISNFGNPRAPLRIRNLTNIYWSLDFRVLGKRGLINLPWLSPGKRGLIHLPWLSPGKRGLIHLPWLSPGKRGLINLPWLSLIIQLFSSQQGF